MLNQTRAAMEAILATDPSVSPEQRKVLLALLDGHGSGIQAGESPDRGLLTLMDTARTLNVSRMTIHRMCADGRLPTVITRAGRRRVPSAAITAMLKEGVQ